MHKTAIPNPALQPFDVLVGEWRSEGTHPLVPNTILHGHSSFAWMEGGAFLVWRSEVDYEGFPTGIAIIGSDDAAGTFYMLYFDERTVSRKYNVSFRDCVLSWWRNEPAFSQRYTWTITNNAHTILGKAS